MSKARVLFFPTAARSEGELEYVEKSRQELLDVGITPENLVTVNVDALPSPKVMNAAEVLYVCGGNTFHLLHKLRETGMDEFLKKRAKAGALYVGVSAGTVVAGPLIDIAAPFDENDAGLTNLKSLKITYHVMSPHFDAKEAGIIDTYELETKRPVTRLRDGQALVVDGNAERVIS